MTTTTPPIYRHTQPGYVMFGAAAAGLVVCLLVGLATGLWLVPGLVALVSLTVLVLMFDLTVEVGEEEIELRFGVGLIRKRVPLRDVVRCDAVRNSFWHGWGIHYVGRGWLYNVSGFDAVELGLPKDRVIRIGTDQPERLAAAIRARLGQGPM